jgi:hypothetical protein
VMKKWIHLLQLTFLWVIFVSNEPATAHNSASGLLLTAC